LRDAAKLSALTQAPATLAAGLSGRVGQVSFGCWLLATGEMIFAATLCAMSPEAVRKA
jgi:hypothetical protein